MAIADLNREKAHATYNPETGIAYIKYSGSLTAEESIAVYEWLADLIDAQGVDGIYGEIFDFRDVTEFAADNLMEARRNSRRYNMRNKGRYLPVAMVISSFFQEEILRGPMQNVEENKRKAIVRTMEEAEAFLDEWNAENAEE